MLPRRQAAAPLAWCAIDILLMAAGLSTCARNDDLKEFAMVLPGGAIVRSHARSVQ
jgi:hypothetical protein